MSIWEVRRSQVGIWEVRKDWIARVPGMRLSEASITGNIIGNTLGSQYLISYEPGDATHYMMSVVPALWSRMANRLGTTQRPYWQLGVWSGSGNGNGTMVVEAGDDGTVCQDDGFIQDELRCSDYSTQVFSIMIHGCLGSHKLEIASEKIEGFRNAGRTGFVDPQIQDGG